MSSILSAAGHSYSTSTQVRISQKGIGTLAVKSLSITGAQEPVELAAYENNLSVSNVNDEFQLSWSNNRESNGYQFEIQYSTDSMALANDVYNILTIVNGQGENASGWTYDYLLENLDENQVYFFRVKTIDDQLQSYYTNIVKITLPLSTGNGPFIGIEKLELKVQSLVTSDLNYILDVPTRLKIGVRLLNSVGAVIHQESNTYEEGSHSLMIPTSSMNQKGMYFMEVSSAAEQISKKVIIR